MKKILSVFGTRPEAIKTIPVMKELSNSFNVVNCVSAQHREMLDQVLSFFEIQPDYDLNTMIKAQDLFDITVNILNEVKKVLIKEEPDLVVVQGDTTTTMSVALASYYLKIPLAHIEAGLRTYNIYSPYPEEVNRQIVSRIASVHFSPTETAKQNLIKEGISEELIFVTGNTVIDSILYTIEKTQAEGFEQQFTKKFPFLYNHSDKSGSVILITGHRRESFGRGFEQICYAIKELAEIYPNFKFVYPVHLNPNVREPVNKILSNQSNIFLIEPLGYSDFVMLMSKSYIILTDSGGIQEEASSLDIPVLVMREVTERVEAIETGVAKLIGTNKDSIIESAKDILEDDEKYKLMANGSNPYGDGTASVKIKEIIENLEL